MILLKLKALDCKDRELMICLDSLQDCVEIPPFIKFVVDMSE